jgi:hypothetical protein
MAGPSKREVDERAEAKVIALGEHAKNLMEDEAFDHVFRMLEKEYWSEFKTSAITPEARALVQAKARVLDDVKASLHVLMDSGSVATVQRERRERKQGE